MSELRILVVGGKAQTHQEVIRVLESHAADFSVEEVPTGEDALLEFARMPVDLLITDLDLPGMSGLELISWASQLNPQSRSILITSATTETTMEQAEALGVVAFLSRPLEADKLLSAVERGMQLLETGGIAPTFRQAILLQLVRMLARIRRILNSEGVFIIDSTGAVIASEGTLGKFNLEALRDSLSAAFGSGLEVSAWLGAEEPWAFHYFDGGDHGCYVANIGHHHGLVIYYRGSRTAGRLEAAAHYCRSAAKGILPLVTNLEALADVVVEEEEPAPPQSETGIEVEGMEELLEDAVQRSRDQDADQYWHTAADQIKGTNELSDEIMTYDEAKEKGILSEEAEEEFEEEDS